MFLELVFEPKMVHEWGLGEKTVKKKKKKNMRKKNSKIKKNY